GDAERVIIALQTSSVLVGEQRRSERKPDLCHVGVATDDGTGDILIELQRNEGGHLVRCILLATEDGYLEHIDYCMAAFVQKHADDRSDDAVFVADVR